MAATLLPPALVITVVGLVWMAYVALRRRYLWRMGSRHFSRRPTETLLVVLGSVLGTALITGSFITSDSLADSFTSEIYRRMGEVDEQVVLANSAAVQKAERNLDRLRGDPLVDGVVLVENDVGTTRSVTDPDATEPRTQVFALDLVDLDHFGSEVQSIGGPNLAGDETIVTKELADELGVQTGDQIELLIYGRTRTLRVRGIAAGDGFAAYRDGHDVYVAKDYLGALAKDAGRRQGAPTQLWVSNTGDRRDGVDRSNFVAAQLESVLGTEGVQVIKTKQSGVEAAEDGAETIGQLFFVVGTFAVIAGVLLLVNIFVMLATERRSELGMLRAVGMKRGDLVRGFALEGTMYGLAAAVLGGALGILVGIAIVVVASSIFGSGAGISRTSLTLRTVLLPATIGSGIVVGFAISFVTIAITSWRISRVNIIAAVRDLDEAKVKKTRARTYVLAPIAVVVGAFATAFGVLTLNAVPAVLGPSLMAIGFAPLLTRLFPRRGVLTVLFGALLAWTLLLGVFFPDILGRQVSPGVFIVYGTVAVVSAVSLVAQNQEALAQVVRQVVRADPRRGLALRLATTYPIARRFRTAMTLIMYALIVFTLTMISTISHVNQINVQSIVRRESSGYDVLVQSNAATPIEARDLQKVAGVVGAVGIMSAPVNVKADGREAQTTVSGADADLLRMSTWSFVDRDPAYADTAAVWDAIENDPGVVALSRRFQNQARGGPPGELRVNLGDEVELLDFRSGRSQKRRVIAFVDSFNTLPGAVIGRRQLERDFAGASTSTWLVRSDPAVGPTAVAKSIDVALVDDGVEAVGYKSRIEDFMKLNLQFFTLLNGYLALGLVIGIVGLGVIMIRAVRERRRAIGILRALGFGASTVRRAFVGEAAIVAAEGILIGVFLGLVTARNLLSSDLAADLDVPFAVPWPTVAILAALAFVLSVVVAVLPAWQASRIRPAVALRIAD